MSQQLLIWRILLALTTPASCGQTGLKTAQVDTTIKNNDYSILADSILQTGWYYIADSANGFKRQLDRDTISYFITPIPIVTAKNIIETEIYTSNYGGKGLSMKLDKVGTQSWSIATGKSIGRQLAFIIDNKLMQTANVQGQITAGMTAFNRGDIYKDELEKIKRLIDTERK